MYLFDTHAHLDDEQFDAGIGEVLERATAAGVAAVVTVGTTLSSSRRSVELAASHDMVFAAVGIQPNYTAEAGTGDYRHIQSLLTHRRVVAIGETGLDHYWDYADLDIQRTFFQRHIQSAQETDLPLVIHMREPRPNGGNASQNACAEDILKLLTAAQTRGPLRGVMHSYTGSIELVPDFLALGFYLSFAGMVTYKKSTTLREVAAAVPEDRLLIETDAPYLSPHPHRGHRPNEPSLVVHTASCLADTRGVTLAELARQTTRNACRLFKLHFDEQNGGVCTKD